MPWFLNIMKTLAHENIRERYPNEIYNSFYVKQKTFRIHMAEAKSILSIEIVI